MLSSSLTVSPISGAWGDRNPLVPHTYLQPQGAVLPKGGRVDVGILIYTILEQLPPWRIATLGLIPKCGVPLDPA